MFPPTIHVPNPPISQKKSYIETDILLVLFSYSLFLFYAEIGWTLTAFLNLFRCFQTISFIYLLLFFRFSCQLQHPRYHMNHNHFIFHRHMFLFVFSPFGVFVFLKIYHNNTRHFFCFFDFLCLFNELVYLMYLFINFMTYL